MKVLVVEDDARLRQYMLEVFDQAGHTPHGAFNIAGAHALLERHRFDVLVIDVFLGPDSGLALAALAELRSPGCRVVMITGSSLFAHGELFDIVPGVTHLLRKPVMPNEFLAVVEHAGPEQNYFACAEKSGDTREEEVPPLDTE